MTLPSSGSIRPPLPLLPPKTACKAFIILFYAFFFLNGSKKSMFFFPKSDNLDVSLQNHEKKKNTAHQGLCLPSLSSIPLLSSSGTPTPSSLTRRLCHSVSLVPPPFSIYTLTLSENSHLCPVPQWRCPLLTFPSSPLQTSPRSPSPPLTPREGSTLGVGTQPLY